MKLKVDKLFNKGLKFQKKIEKLNKIMNDMVNEILKLEKLNVKDLIKIDNIKNNANLNIEGIYQFLDTNNRLFINGLYSQLINNIDLNAKIFRSLDYFPITNVFNNLIDNNSTQNINEKNERFVILNSYSVNVLNKHISIILTFDRISIKTFITFALFELTPSSPSGLNKSNKDNKNVSKLINFIKEKSITVNTLTNNITSESDLENFLSEYLIDDFIDTKDLYYKDIIKLNRKVSLNYDKYIEYTGYVIEVNNDQKNVEEINKINNIINNELGLGFKLINDGYRNIKIMLEKDILVISKITKKVNNLNKGETYINNEIFNKVIINNIKNIFLNETEINETNKEILDILNKDEYLVISSTIINKLKFYNNELVESILGKIKIRKDFIEKDNQWIKRIYNIITALLSILIIFDYILDIGDQKELKFNEWIQLKAKDYKIKELSFLVNKEE